MNCLAFRAVCFLLFIILIAFSPLSNAASEYGTFESFYKESSNINWWLAGLFALIAAAVIFFTGATASPVVLGVGTWVGNLMGLSGAVATNVGLALLGGGSIASGGFGIIGGVALLTAALSFGTDIVVDYSLSQGISRYDYGKFAEQSSSMATLPLPRNDTGPKPFKAALKKLEEIDKHKSVFDSRNQAIIQKAVLPLEKENTRNRTDRDLLREEALLALLKMLQNDYRGAKTASLSAYNAAERSQEIATFPAFIYATSLVYDDEPDFDQIYKYFSYAVTEEQENKFRPLLFGILLDRMAYRMADGALSSKVLSQLYELSKQFEYGEDKAAIQQLILVRYFVQLKLEQQKILTLVCSESNTIRKSSKTLDVVKTALTEYRYLLIASEAIIDDQQSEIMGHDKDWWHSDWEKEWAKINDSNRQLLSSYDNGSFALDFLVIKFAIPQFIEKFYATHSLAVARSLNKVMTSALILLIGICLFIALVGNYLYRIYTRKVNG